MRVSSLLLTVMLASSPALLGAAPPDESTAIFDGKTFDGWEGDTKNTWRIEDGVIVGGSMKGNPRNQFLATTKSYKDFDFKCEYKLVGTEGFVNSGVQFRSVRMKNPANEMYGYQADIGAGNSGCLYDESRRNRFDARATDEQIKRLEKPGDWNQYRILAQGLHIQIFLNGEKTVDYTEPDKTLPQEGLIGLQMHGGNKAVVYFRNIVIEELPEQKASILAGPAERFASAIEPTPKLNAFVDGKLAMNPGEVVVFTGPENTVIEQRAGWLELMLTAGFKNRHPQFRHMGWEGDTVYRQNRMMNWGSWRTNLAAVGATTVVTWFGQMEAIDPARSPDDFATAYAKFLAELAQQTPPSVTSSPARAEKPVSAPARA